MKLKDVLLKYKGMALDQSIEAVALALGAAPVLIAIKSAKPDDLQFQVAADKNGAFWIYAFSDQDELSKTFPSGAAFAEMNFADVLMTIGPDERFGGIFINSKSDAMYVVPRQLFGFVYKKITSLGK